MSAEHSPDDVVGFITGDMLATIMVWIHFDVAAFEVKLAMTIIFGLLGGAAGMAGKDLYNWLKEKWLL
jgi:hypothetical protein